MKKITSILLGMMAVAMLVSCEKDPQPEPEPTPVDPEDPAVLVMIPDAVTDIEGHHYDAVQIGSQVWMAQNLRTHRYADSTFIPHSNYTNGGQLQLYCLQGRPVLSRKRNQNDARKIALTRCLPTFASDPPEWPLPCVS